MLTVERQAQIVEMARERQFVKVVELMERFAVSDMTIRRDLTLLEKKGIVKKVYGGAMLISSQTDLEQDVDLLVRLAAHVNLKKDIALRASELIQPDDVIILDAGTTTLELAKVLPDYKDMVVVTNSISIAHELVSRPFSVLLAGGIVRPSTYSTVGPKTKEFLSDLRATKLFLGASSLSISQGMMNSNLYESEIKRTMMSKADQIIVVADSNKFESNAYHVFATWSEVDILVTDHYLSEEIISHIEDQGVQVLVSQIAPQ